MGIFSREIPGNVKLLYRWVKSFQFHYKTSVFVEQWMFSAILFRFERLFFNFCEKNIFDPGNLPNTGSKSSKSISSTFTCKIDLKWCIFVTYAKISIYFGQNFWKCSENPHISQIKRKNISRISREIQAKISRETGREFSGISREFPGGNSRDGNPNNALF